MTDKKAVAAEVDPEVKTAIRIAAARRDISMADWLREAIDEKLERENEGGSGNSHRAAATAD
jgi:predicted HicB family RNase H-like nuclease